MKKILLSLALVMTFIFSAGLVSAAPEDTLKADLAKSITANMKKGGRDINVDVEIITKLDQPAGYYYIKLTFYDAKAPSVVAGEQMLFTDGKFIVQDFLKAEDMSSLAKNLSFEFSKKDIDTTGLTPIIGKPGAKNVVVEVTDFQCPFCVKMNEYLHAKFEKRKDTVVYIMHFPLRNMHPKAELLAKVFEAGMMMKANLVNDLYDEENADMTDVQIIDKYAKKSGDAKKFKALVASKEVAAKVAAAEAKANELGVRSTPTMFVNGKMISGYDLTLMDKAIADLK